MIFIQAVNMFFQALIYLILGRAIMSWFIRPGDRLYPLYSILIRVTEPILRPCRNLTYRFGMNSGMDFSPIVALFAIWVIRQIVIRLLMALMF